MPHRGELGRFDHEPAVDGHALERQQRPQAEDPDRVLRWFVSRIEKHLHVRHQREVGRQLEAIRGLDHVLVIDVVAVGPSR